MISTHKTRVEAEIKREEMKRTFKSDSAYYRKANGFLTDLRKKWKRRQITSQQYGDIRKMATSGDLDGANKALGNVLMENTSRRLGL